MMNILQATEAGVQDALGLDADEIARRKSFLGFGEREAQLLREIHTALKGRHFEFADAFYEHLHSFAETRSFLSDPALAARLRQKQAAYFDALTAGDYGAQYAASRLKAGLTHQQIGLKPQWCLGAYGKYLDWMLPEIGRELADDAEKYCATCLALVKILLFDIELVVDAYFHAEHEMVRLFAQVFESNIEGVLIVDKGARILHANRKVTAISGFSAEEIAGKNLETLFSAHQPGAFAQIWDKVKEHGHWQGEVLHQGKGGRDYPAWMNVSGVKGDDGKTTHYVVEFSDITRYKEAQEALRRRTEELARSNQELEQFAYVASHDLQEPLRMVASFTQLLARRYQGKLGEDADEFIHYAVDGATRMQSLINDLLAYSRVGTHAKPFEPTDAKLALERALRNLKLVIGESGAEIMHEPLPTVLADLSQLTQLFQNLIGNAVKFRGGEAPRIQISAVSQEKEWLFEVRDNGIGIAPESAERIFVIFQRLHAKEEYPGTGIGLAVCKKIVERHGGRIWVESEPGSGAAFCFTLPKITS